MPIHIAMPLFCKQIIESDKPYYILYGGRLGGKTNNTAKIGILTMLMYPYYDIIMARVSYGSLGDSSYSEVQGSINDMGDVIADQFKFKKSPLRIERVGNGGTIYFIGYGGSNTSRTKSIKPKHKIKVVILEETQELKNEENLNQALASFRRHFGDDVKVFILGNPYPQKVHWFSKFIESHRYDPDYEVMNVTYLDILPFINDYDLKEILKMKLLNPEYYRWFYLGEMTGGFGMVYPMFRRDKYVISKDDWEYVLQRSTIRPIGLMIGGDGAVNNDCTSFVPMVLLNNGQVVIGPIFNHDPIRDGAVGYHQLVQDKLLYWFENITTMFHLGTILEHRMYPNKSQYPIWMRIDSAAPDLIQECRFFMGDRASIGPVKKDHVPQMVSTVQSAILNENIIIIDYGGEFNYTSNKFMKRDVNLLAEQLESLIWNEKQDNYEPAIPNDTSDAFTYGTISWYKNPENIQYFNIAKMKNRQTLLISDILKDRNKEYMNEKKETLQQENEQPKVELTEEEKAQKREDTKKAIHEAIKQKAIKEAGLSEEDAQAALEMLEEADMPVNFGDEDFKLGRNELDVRNLSDANYKQLMFRVTLLNGVYLRQCMKFMQDILNAMFVELDAMGVENLLKSSDRVLAKLRKEQDEIVAKQILDSQKKKN